MKCKYWGTQFPGLILSEILKTILLAEKIKRYGEVRRMAHIREPPAFYIKKNAYIRWSKENSRSKNR